MKQNEVFGILRAVLAAVGGMLVANGYVNASDWAQINGAIIVVVTAIWSVLEKRNLMLPPSLGAAILLLAMLPQMGCISSTMEQIRKHDAKVIQMRLTPQGNGVRVEAGVDLLQILDTGWWAALKADPASMLSAMGLDTAKTAALGAAGYYGGKGVGLWGKKSASDPSTPSVQINNNSGTVNVSGRDNANSQSTAVSP